MRYRSNMSEDEIDKTKKRLLKLVHSVDHDSSKGQEKVSWSPFELCQESLVLVSKVVEYSERIANVLEKKGTSELDDTIQQFVGANVLASKAVLFHLLKLSYQIRSGQDESQSKIIEYAVSLQIFEEALQELKIDAEAGYEKAAVSLADVQRLISEQMNRKGCDLDLVFDVINALNDAKIEIIEPIKTAMLRLGDNGDIEEYHGDLPPLEKMIEGLQDDGKSIFEVYEILASPSRAMPIDGRFEFVKSLNTVSGSLGRDLLILTCLDRELEVRRFAVKLLIQRKIRDFDERSLRQLQCLSQWLFDEKIKTSLEWLIRKLKMSGLTCAKPHAIPNNVRIIATAFDGSGCQVIFGAIPNGDESQTFGIMFKQSEGIEDAWISNHLSSKEFQSAVDHAELMPEQYEIDFEYLKAVIPFFLARSQKSGEPVPTGLLALADIIPLDVLVPDSESLLGKSARMLDLLQERDESDSDLTDGFLRIYENCYHQMWFEEGSEVERIVSDYKSDTQALMALRLEIIETNRKKWEEKFLLMSVLLFLSRQNAGRRWQDFFYIFTQFATEHSSNLERVFDAISIRSRDQMVERITK